MVVLDNVILIRYLSGLIFVDMIVLARSSYDQSDLA